MRRLLRFIRHLAITLAVLVLLVVAAAWGVLGTTPGTKWALREGIRAGGVDADFESLDGNLLGRLELRGVKVVNNDKVVELGRAVLDWTPTALLERRVAIGELRLNDVTLTLPETPPEPGEPVVEVPALPAVSLPVSVDVARLEVTALRLAPGAEPVLDRAAAALSLQGDALEVTGLTAQRAALEATLDATVSLRDGDWPVQGRLAAKGREDDLDIDASATVTGSARQPAIALEVRGPVSVSGTVAADLRTHPPAAQVALEWQELTLDGAPLGSPAGTLALETRDRAFTIDVAADLVDAPSQLRRITLAGDATLERFTAPWAFTTDLRWSAAALETQFEGRLAASGDAAAVNLDHQLVAPFQVSTRGDVTPNGVNTEVALRGDWQGVRWPPAGEGGPASPAGSYDVKGNIDGFIAEVNAAVTGVEGLESAGVRIDGAASAQAPHPFRADVSWHAVTAPAGRLSGTGNASGDTQAIRFDHRLSGPGELDTAGSVTLAPALSLDVTGTVAVPRWPLGDEPAVASGLRAEFTVNGPVDALATTVDGAVDTPSVGPVTLKASTTVHPDAAKGLDLTLGLLEGGINLIGDVGWKDAPSATLEVQASAINPRRLHPQAAGALDARLTTDLRIRDGAPQGPVVLHRLGGTLGGYPVRGQGRIQVLADGFETEGLTLSSGSNTLAVNGRMREALDLGLDLDAPALEQLWPTLSGALKGVATIRGTPASPSIAGSFSAAALRAGEVRIASATAEVDAGLSPGARTRVSLDANRIRTGGASVDKASMNLDGTVESHRLSLAADTDQGQLALRASGGLAGETWTGTVSELAATQTPLGDWTQIEPWSISASPAGARTDRACLASDEARLCVKASQPSAQTQALDVTLTALPMSRFAPWIGEGLTVTGELAAEAAVRVAGAGGIDATASIVPSTTVVKVDESAAGTPLELELEDTRIDARHSGAGTVAEVRSRIAGDGKLAGNLRLAADGRGLGGRIEASLPDLKPVRALLPALNELAGRLDARLDLDGTVDRPRIAGEAALRDARAGVPVAGITVEDVGVTVTASPDGSVRLNGSARSGEGELKLTGSGRLDPENWSATLNLKGENFEAAKLISVQALMSPDLQLAATPESLSVTGKVHVPEATVAIKEVPPDVVAVSDDEIIVGREPRPVSGLKQKLDVKVDVSLGDRVSISAFGLDTRIDGGLAIAMQGASPPTGRGTLNLRDGRFTAYGQDLQIQRGRLLFAGPLDNPGLDVRAVRDAGEVVAGIQVSGTADNLRSKVFSEPPLPQAEALSWLLTGRGLSGASQSDGATLAGAALALGLDQSEQVTRQIGTSLGLDELSVAPGSSLEESNLVLGKALSPKLYIRYALGVVGGVGSMLLNYRLTDHISVEAETGEAQGADLLYRLER